jgi:ATP-dependent exoDNAse (exonuclease V) beta subunit
LGKERKISINSVHKPADMSDKPFIIYKSSAGSGKTYTLAMEYLKIALEQPFAFKNILAVTFTNKATQEMKERILEVLRRLVHTVDPEETLDKALLKHLGASEKQLKERAYDVLTAILHHYADFSISTIDSFFQRVVRAFAREIDLQAKFDIELDQAGVLERLVDRLIYKVGEDKSLHRWLVDFADEKIREGKSWDIRGNINQLGAQIFQEDFKKHQHEIRTFLKDPQNILDFRSRLFEEREVIRNRVRKIKEAAEAIRNNYGLSWDDFKGGSRSFILFFERMDQGNTLFPNISATLASCPDNLPAWSTQKGPVAKIEQAYHEGLNELLKEALALVPRWNTLEAVRRNFYVFGIFSRLLEELQELKDEENIMLISDANEFLKEITADTDAPFIYEKVGNQYKNFLIDEFQDTSGFQWASFHPLLDNAMASGHTSLIVGDVKQSIYRWRGGDLTLLLREVEQQIGPERVEIKDLDTNFRSLPLIVNFNNALFEGLASSVRDAAKEKYGVDDDLLMAIEGAYLQVRQKVAPHKQKQTFKGKVKIEFLKEEEEQKVAEQAILKLPSMVQVLQDQGYSLKDIVVLVRTKAEGQLVAETLMDFGRVHAGDGYRYDVLSGEAMFLHKASSVRCLIATLTYLLHPDDDISARAMWYNREVVRGGIGHHGLFDEYGISEQITAEVNTFEKDKSALVQLPLFELVEELVDRFGFNTLGKERAYISGFREAVFDYVSKNKSDLGGFLEWWALKKDTRTVKVPESHDAIRIMTIHKSKGLQFKVVLMPFMDWDIVSSRGILWSAYEESESSQLIVPLSLTAALAQTSFADRYRQEVMMAYLDSLNMIYVALTRAEEVIWALSEEHPPKGEGALNKLSYNIQNAILAAMGQNDQLNLSNYYQPETRVMEIGDWPEVKNTSVVVPPLPELSWAYRNWSSLLKVKKYTEGLSEEMAALQAKRNYGVVIHRILEKLKGIGELEALLQEAYFDGRLELDEVNEVKSLLKQLLENPQMQEWFATDEQALTEQAIILPGGSSKRPDRILVMEGKAVVIDFKTGGEKENHNTQVREYIALVSALTQKPTEGYLVYIESGMIKKIDSGSSQYQLEF